MYEKCIQSFSMLGKAKTTKRSPQHLSVVTLHRNTAPKLFGTSPMLKIWLYKLLRPIPPGHLYP